MMQKKDKVTPIWGVEDSEKDKQTYKQMQKKFLEGMEYTEERLLNDPELKSTSAPDDMFEIIMENLRIQGKLRSTDMISQTELSKIQETGVELSDEDKEALLLGRMVKSMGINAQDIQRLFENKSANSTDLTISRRLPSKLKHRHRNMKFFIFCKKKENK